MGLFDIFSNKSAEKAAAMSNAGLQKGYDALSGFYGQGRDAITGYGDKAAGVYTGMLDTLKPGADAYGDVSGAHGVEGLERGTNLFKNSGQYGVYGVANDAAQKAIARQGAAKPNFGGTNYSGADTASKLAGQNWGTFQSGLLPYLTAEQNAGSGLANVYTGVGKDLNASFMGQGGAANAMETGVGKNLAGAELNKYQVGSNIWNGIMGGAKLLAGAAGGGGGFSGANSLFSGFGGGGGSYVEPTQNLTTSFQNGQWIPTYA